VPAFLVLAAIEAIVVSRRPGGRYQLGDLASGVSCGALDLLVNLAVVAGFLAIYDRVHRWSPVGIDPTSVAGWAACVVAHDLAYYVFHRVSHRVNVLWAAHALHHQSEDYTFAVSLRQGAIATWIVYWFYLPLALAFPLGMFIAVHGVYQIYQFFVHTRLVPSLGPLEKILATPMLHRVHHGRDPACLDRNYGGFFIVWDRLFGTYAPYTSEPDYGVTTGIASWSPYWANLGPYVDLVRRVRRAPRWRDRLAVFVRPPEWAPAWDRREQSPLRYGPPVSRRVSIYGLVHLVVAVVVSLALAWGGAPDGIAEWALAGFVFMSLFTIAALFDGKRWARAVEAARLAMTTLTAAGAAITGLLPVWAAVAAAGGCVASLVALRAQSWRPGPLSAGGGRPDSRPTVAI